MTKYMSCVHFLQTYPLSLLKFRIARHLRAYGSYFRILGSLEPKLVAAKAMDPSDWTTNSSFPYYTNVKSHHPIQAKGYYLLGAGLPVTIKQGSTRCQTLPKVLISPAILKHVLPGNSPYWGAQILGPSLRSNDCSVNQIGP